VKTKNMRHCDRRFGVYTDEACQAVKLVASFPVSWPVLVGIQHVLSDIYFRVGDPLTDTQSNISRIWVSMLAFPIFQSLNESKQATKPKVVT